MSSLASFSRSFLLATSVLLLAQSSLAIEGLFTGIHHHYQSPRALGMGDSFVAVADDYSLLFYNPAGLARLEESSINLSMDFGISSSYLAFEKEITAATKSGGTEAEQQAKITQVLQNNYGRIYSSRIGAFHGVYVGPNFGFAVIPADFTTEYTVQDQAVPSLNARVYLDTTIAAGYGKEIKGFDSAGRLSWGTTVKFINRGYFSKQVNLFDLAADPEALRPEDMRDGFTIDADIGLLYTPFLPMDGFWSLLRLARPTFGAVVRNVGDYGFNQSLNVFTRGKKSATPEKLRRVFDFGTKWEYPSFWIFGGRGVMDFRDIGHPNYSFKKGLHLGFEFDWTVSSWWKGQYRFGLNQGYLTLGASALFALFRLDLVNYGEDVGTFSSPKENRIWALKMNVDW